MRGRSLAFTWACRRAVDAEGLVWRGGVGDKLVGAGGWSGMFGEEGPPRCEMCSNYFIVIGIAAWAGGWLVVWRCAGVW